MTPRLAEQRREHMVATQLAGRGIRSAAVLSAMRTVPREAFVAPGDEHHAYDDAARPIAQRQTLSQPYIVALMAEAAELAPGDAVLEVGAGSGYAAAVLSRIAAHVVAVERNATLAALGYRNVDIVLGDGTLGWPGDGRFDAILVAAGGPEVPPALKAQLADGGRLVMPVGHPGQQRLVKITRLGEGGYAREVLADVTFVPLVGAQGWRSEAMVS